MYFKKQIKSIFTQHNQQTPLIGIALTFIGFSLLDFSADSCDSPLRAFLLDVCNSNDQNTGLNFHAFLGGAGASCGYILTAFDLNETFLGSIRNIF